MQYRLLGSSGLRVSELALGTMTFGEEWNWGSDKETSKTIFDMYANADGNFIDTANLYTNGTSERYVGDFIAADRDYWVVATKYTLSMFPNDPNGSGNHRKNMKRSLEASLKRLNTDYIDLYWVHAWDFLTSEEEILRGLDDLVRAGKILYIGISDAPAWIVSRANTIADLRGWSRFVALQIQYSLADRTPERDLIPMAKALDLSVTPWGILGGGVLSGKYNLNTDEAADGRVNQRGGPRERDLKIAEVVMAVADEIGCQPAQVAQRWMQHQGDHIIPILGVRRIHHMEAALSSLDVSLSDEQLQRLDEASRVDMGFPHDFLAEDRMRAFYLGEHRNNIYNHRRS